MEVDDDGYGVGRGQTRGGDSPPDAMGVAPRNQQPAAVAAACRSSVRDAGALRPARSDACRGTARLGLDVRSSWRYAVLHSAFVGCKQKAAAGDSLDVNWFGCVWTRANAYGRG